MAVAADSWGPGPSKAASSLEPGSEQTGLFSGEEIVMVEAQEKIKPFLKGNKFTDEQMSVGGLCGVRAAGVRVLLSNSLGLLSRPHAPHSPPGLVPQALLSTCRRPDSGPGEGEMLSCPVTYQEIYFQPLALT